MHSERSSGVIDDAIGVYQTLASLDGAAHGLPLDRADLQLDR